MDAEFGVPSLRLLGVGEIERFTNERMDLTEMVDERREVGEEGDRRGGEGGGELGGHEGGELLTLYIRETRSQ